MSVVANVAINVDSRNAVSQLRAVQSQALSTEKAFNGINRAAISLRTAFAGIGVAGLVAQTARAAASFNDLQLRLKLLTSEYGETAKAQAFAAKSAKTFGLSTREATAGVANIYARLRPLGISLKDIESTFTGFNTVAKLSGVGAAESSAAFTQLAQALGSGRLQGDEFRSIAEQVPGILVAISKETGVAAGNLKDYAKEGNLTSEIVIKALARIEKEGAGKIAQIIKESDTQRFKDFQNAVDDLSIAVGNELLPTITPLIEQTTKLIRTIAELPEPVKSGTVELVKLAAQALLVSKAIQGIIALRAGFVASMTAVAATTVAAGTAAKTSSSAFALYAANTKTLQAAAATATPVLTGLRAVLANLAAFGVITVGINLVVTGLQEAMAAAAETRRLRGERAAGGAAAIYGGSATKGQKATAQKTLQSIRKEQAKYQQPGTIAAQTLLGPASQLFGIPTTAQAGARRTVLGERALRAQATMGLPTRQEATGIGGGGAVGGGSSTDGGGGTAKQARESEIPALQTELDLKNKILALTGRIGEARLSGNKATEAALQIEQILEERSAKIAGINRQQIPNAEKELQIKIATATADQQLVEASLARQQAELDRQNQLNQIIDDLANETALVMASTPAIRQKVELEQQIAKLKKDGVIKNEKEAQAIRDATAALEKQKQIREQITRQQEMLNQAIGQIGQTLGSQLTAVFDNLINKTRDWNSVLSDVLNQVGRVLMMAGLNALADMGDPSGKSIGILSFLGFGKRAGGGPVNAGAPYVVGERGPELFVPGANGGVMSNSDLRSAMGSAPGSSSGPVLNMSFETTNIGGVEYVSRDQLEAAMAATRRQAARDGAKRGMDMTLDRLQQSPSTRNRVGLR